MKGDPPGPRNHPGVTPPNSVRGQSECRERSGIVTLLNLLLSNPLPLRSAVASTPYAIGIACMNVMLARSVIMDSQLPNVD
ncbi:lipoprotein, putative [Edwardsiella ictaluri 93-146]|uniref:Lipoprotein, putative n=1 Tax=Edwardsiella ictaluri (strain 93-146) TaxID=634503 RepID=C5BD29_EDWI9|nr:lipoprotein, putative [Edwardsiella ictaluri 93-146]